MLPSPAFSTARADVLYFNDVIAVELQDYLLRNKERLKPFEPARGPEYFELTAITRRVEQAVEDQTNSRGSSFVITPKNSRQMIGVINFTNFVFGVFQACHLGFSIDADYEGNGVMTEVLQAAIQHVRATFGLHRIMANHLPDNNKSERLLNKLGFEREGYPKSYLKINGTWQDHVLTSLVFDD